MTHFTYTGSAYTNITNTAGAYYPLNETGASTGTVGSSATLNAKRVAIHAIVVRSYTASMTFDLNTYDPAGPTTTLVASFSPTATGSFDFGPIGIELPFGWSLTQGATSGTVTVIWKVIE